MYGTFYFFEEPYHGCSKNKKSPSKRGMHRSHKALKSFSGYRTDNRRSSFEASYKSVRVLQGKSGSRKKVRDNRKKLKKLNLTQIGFF